jgi:hypothetical protein
LQPEVKEEERARHFVDKLIHASNATIMIMMDLVVWVLPREEETVI